MKKDKLPKDKYTPKRYDDLFFAVNFHGSSFHKDFFNLMVEADFSKKKIFSNYMNMLRRTSQVNHNILKSVGVRNFAFKMDD